MKMIRYTRLFIFVTNVWCALRSCWVAMMWCDILNYQILSSRFHPSGDDPCLVRIKINGHDVADILLNAALELGAARAILNQLKEGETNRPSSSISLHSVAGADVARAATPKCENPVESAPVSRPLTPALTYPTPPSTTSPTYPPPPSTTSPLYPPPPSTTLVAYMSHFDSLASFFIGACDRLDALTCFAESLNNRYDQPDADNLKLKEPVNVKDMVCARWSEDDQWYRAKVEEVQENIVRVKLQEWEKIILDNLELVK